VTTGSIGTCFEDLAAGRSSALAGLSDRHAASLFTGDPDAALAGAARRVEADYEIPFQGHTSIRPAHALADPSGDQLTIYSNDMKSYGLRTGVAEFLQIPRDRVRVV
jgi:CO/xanthine dehydrogenase Mo-binding subunit